MGLIKFNKDAPINEIIGLLHSFDEKELFKLRDEFPEHAELLKPGITLGEEEVKDELIELKVRASVCKTGLNLILNRAETILPKIKSRLRLLNNIQFISQIVVAISGASILVFIQEKHGEATKIIIGSLTLIAALLTLFFQNKSGTIALGENSLSKIFNDLTDYKLNAEYFLEELRIIEKLNFSSSTEQVSQIIQKSNDISLQIKKIIQKY
jgi:hypothetical protein